MYYSSYFSLHLFCFDGYITLVAKSCWFFCNNSESSRSPQLLLHILNWPPELPGHFKAFIALLNDCLIPTQIISSN